MLLQAARYLATGVRGNAFNMTQPSSIPAVFLSEVDRIERAASPELFKSSGAAAWRAHIERKCGEIVKDESYYKAEEGALGPDHEAFYETVRSESLRILRGYVKKGGNIKDITAMLASEDVAEGAKYTPVPFRLAQLPTLHLPIDGQSALILQATHHSFLLLAQRYLPVSCHSPMHPMPLSL